MNFLDKLLGIPTGGYGVAPIAATYTMGRKQSTADIVEQIHREFNTAGDKLLSEAVAVINNTDASSFKKADELLAIGFGNSVGVKEATVAKNELANKKKLQQLLVDYSVKYPTYRFIDDESIAVICKKYSLVFGSAGQYTGFVPAKNLAEIKAFPGVREEDFIWQERSTWAHDTKPGDWRNVGRPKQPSDYSSYESYNEHMMMTSSFSRHEKRERRTSKDLLICAPLKDMKLNANQEVKGHEIVTVTEYPDPVVLLPVKGNLYIILTAWGDEASDPLVQKKGLN